MTQIRYVYIKKTRLYHFPDKATEAEINMFIEHDLDNVEDVAEEIDHIDSEYVESI